jgi:hypothetical protein
MEEVMNGNKGLFVVSFSFFFMLFGMIAAMVFVGVEEGALWECCRVSFA